MQAAAIALLHGWDPMEYLKLRGREALVAQAVLQKAQALYSERHQAEVKSLGATVANAVAKQLARLFRG